MHRTARRGSGAVVAVPLLLSFLAMVAAPAAASRPDHVIALPGASSAEGIAAAAGAGFYAGDLFRGDIFRGDLQRGTAERFIDAPQGRMAVGMPPTSPMSCCSSPAASGTPTSTTPAPGPPWPPTSSPTRPPASSTT
jgi:hypothetical protein